MKKYNHNEKTLFDSCGLTEKERADYQKTSGDALTELFQSPDSGRDCEIIERFFKDKPVRLLCLFATKGVGFIKMMKEKDPMSAILSLASRR